MGGRALQLAEPAGVPELIAEVAAQFHLLFIVKDVLPERGGPHHPKPERVGPVELEYVEGFG